MEIISFTCSNCDKGFKVGSDKAGRRTKCPKCGHSLTVPSVSGGSSAVPFADDDEDDEDEGGSYGIVEAPTDDKPAEYVPAERPKKRSMRKIVDKKVQFADDWEDSTKGYLFMFIALCLWGAAALFQLLVLFIGLFNGRHYAIPAERAADPETGFDWTAFALGIIGGPDLITLGRVFYILAAVLQMGQWGTAIVAYFLCMRAPNQHGIKGQLITCIVLAGVNLLFLIVLRLLPLCSVYSPMYPVSFPELAMMQANAERLTPIHLFWAGSAYFEALTAVTVLLVAHADTIMFCIFFYTTGYALKITWQEQTGLKLTRLGFGQLFIFLSYLLLSFAGTSGALQMYLRGAYFLWVCFFTGFIITAAVRILQAKSRVMETLYPELQEGGERDEYEDEDEDWDD